MGIYCRGDLVSFYRTKKDDTQKFLFHYQKKKGKPASGKKRCNLLHFGWLEKVRSLTPTDRWYWQTDQKLYPSSKKKVKSPLTKKSICLEQKGYLDAQE